MSTPECNPGPLSSKFVHDAANMLAQHKEGHRTDKPDHGIASTPQIEWLRYISETLDSLLHVAIQTSPVEYDSRYVE